MPERSIAFDRIADRYDETRGGLERGRAFALGLLPSLPPGVVLEVGVGTGAIALPLVEAGRTVLGVDLSRPMLVRAQGRIGSRVAQADATRLPVRDDAVDAAIAVWTLSLVADPAALVAECARVLRPGGRLAVVRNQAEPEDDDMEAFVSVHEARRAHQDRVEDLVGYGAPVGLDVVEASFLAHPFEQTPSTLAGLYEQRAFSTLFDLDDATYERVFAPAVEGLRSLPEPDRPRRKAGRHAVIVLQKD